MIFYKAIKYTIFDFCIEKLFNQINKNLKKPVSSHWDGIGGRIGIEDLDEGLFVSKIRIYSDVLRVWTDYNNCTIYAVRPATYKTRIPHRWELGFKFETNGSGEQTRSFTSIHEDEIEIYS